MKNLLFLAFGLFFQISLVYAGGNSEGQIRGLNDYTSFEEVKMGNEFRELQGKVFYIFSSGNSNMDQSSVRNWAMIRASTVAYDLGYSTFTILDQYANSEIRNEIFYENYTETVYRTVYTSRNVATQVPQTVVRTRPVTRQVVVYYCNLQIGLITEDEFENVRNIHNVSQYLPKSYFK